MAWARAAPLVAHRGEPARVAPAGAWVPAARPPSVPVYQPATTPPLPDGPCKFSAAPATSLCSGRAGCPAVVDAQLAGDAATQGLDLAVTTSGGAHVTFASTYPSAAGNCLFTIDPAGADNVTLNPFGPAPTLAGYSGPTVSLATDRDDGPHAFLSANTGLRHYYPSGTSWLSETIPLPVANVGATVWGALGAKGAMAVLVGSHPSDPGYYRLFALHLFSSSDGGGTWQTTQVFDGAGTQELMSASLSSDATGELVATYDTRLDLSSAATTLGYAAYLWRGGSTSSLSTPSATWEGELLHTPGDATSQDSVVRFSDTQGIHLVFPRAGQAPRDLLVPGTAPAPLGRLPGELRPGDADDVRGPRRERAAR